MKYCLFVATKNGNSAILVVSEENATFLTDLAKEPRIAQPVKTLMAWDFSRVIVVAHDEPVSAVIDTVVGSK